MLYFCVGLVGLVIGLLIGCIFRRSTDGELIVNDEDPETTKWTLQVTKDLNKISKKKYLHLKIKKES
jgi:hypothetical protein